MSPVKPQDLEPLIIVPSDTFCVAFKKLLQAAYKYYLWVRYCNDPDGLIADIHAADLCNKVSTTCVAPTTAT